MKIVFFGSGEFGRPTLESLHASHEVQAIVTQPDRPAGRRRQLTATPIGQWAESTTPDTPLFKPENVNVDDVRDAIRAFDADAWVIIAFGQKLSPALLADRFAVNLHASLLPRWRGAAPIHRAIIAGDTVTGNSVITLADRMDAGLVLGQSHRPIEPAQTTGELHDLLAADGPALVEQVLQAHASGTLAPVEQDESAVTLAPKLSRTEAVMDWTEPAELCRAKINGLSPWPGVTIETASGALKLLRADRAEATDAAPGVVIDPAAGVIGCGDGAIRLVEVQPAGKRGMPWGDFARGQQFEAGERIDAE